MVAHGFFGLEIYIRPSVLAEMMKIEAARYPVREQDMSPVTIEHRKTLLAGEPVAQIFGRLVYDMPLKATNDPDAVICAQDKPYYVIVGKEKETGVIREWLVR